MPVSKMVSRLLISLLTLVSLVAGAPVDDGMKEGEAKAIACCNAVKEGGMKCAVADTEKHYSDEGILPPLTELAGNLAAVADEKALEALKNRTESVPSGEVAKQIVEFIHANDTLHAKMVAVYGKGLKTLFNNANALAAFEKCVGGGKDHSECCAKRGVRR